MAATITITANTAEELNDLLGNLGFIREQQVTASGPSTSSLAIPPAPAPEAASEPEPEPEEDEAGDPNVLVDRKGVAFNPEIHSSSRKIYDSGPDEGQFHRRRGVGKDRYDALYASVPAPAPAPAETPPPPAPAPAAETPPAPAAAEPPPPPAPAPGPATKMQNFAHFAQYIGRETQAGRLTDADVSAVLADNDISSVPQVSVALKNDPSLLASLHIQLQAKGGAA